MPFFVFNLIFNQTKLKYHEEAIVNKKTLYTIFFIILLLVILVLKCSVIDDTIGLNEPTVTVSTFRELVLDDYIEKSTGDEFRNMNLFWTSGDDHEGRDCNDKDLMNVVMDRLCEIELVEYDDRTDQIPDEYYYLHINGEKAGEDIDVKFLGEYLYVSSSVLAITEDKQRKIIHYDNTTEHKLFRITGNNLEDGYLEELFDTLKERL
jgi:hypothetical protein